jgi:hypothetical protein
MKERLTKGWTFTRVLYLALGAFVVAQSIMQQQWLGILLGGYFASMGLFSFGCAAGGCFGSCHTPARGNAQSKEGTAFEANKKYL